VPAAAVVEALDPAEEGESCLVTRLERVPVEEFGLECGEEALGDGVVEGVAGRPMLGSTPASCIVLPKARLVYWEPRSE